MTALLISSLLLLAADSTGATDDTITTVILVRHAEKADGTTDDPGLMPEGEQRALDLARVLKDTQVDAIYSTSYRRTRLTVAPLANDKKLEVRAYRAFEKEDILAMVGEHRGGTIVIVGHSDSVPWTLRLLTGDERYRDFESEDYDNLLIVAVARPGKATKVIWLSYGSGEQVPRDTPSMMQRDR